jgi:hypothetical protein
MAELILHRHHTVPRHIGGHDSPTVLMTIAEHAEEHRKLWEAHGRWQDRVAWQALTGQIAFQEATRIAISEGGKQAARFLTGKKRSQQAREKMSVSAKKRGDPKWAWTKTARQRAAASNTGQKRSDLARKRMSEAMTAVHARKSFEQKCVECGDLFVASRPARTCSNKCNVRRWRRGHQ